EVFDVPIAHARSVTATGPVRGNVDDAPRAAPATSSTTTAPWYDAVAPFTDLDSIAAAVHRHAARDRSQSAPYVAPRTDLEVILASIWQELLGLEQVGIEDDFFASGGDSLLGVRAVARIESLLGLELPLHELFENPTIAAMAQWLSEATRETTPIEI